jgi:predicted transposase YbfD/YdcC
VLGLVPPAKRLFTGDALYCQRELCRGIDEGGGAYLFAVKENQPDLHDDLRWLFEWPAPGETFATAVRHDQHGGRVETRRLWASTALAGYSDWPGLRQACKLERTVVHKGTVTTEVRYAITSLGPKVGPARLLSIWRGHWAIENRLHYVRDVTLGEDASQVRSGSAPQVLAALRNATIALLRNAGATNVAAAVRAAGWQAGAALRLLGLSP